tara:strand:+ start:42231 stop:43217 length:987 start_codon:yes stop_codon:yes gene_type:complete
LGDSSSRILIIGAGHLGSRHLQGLCKINRDIKISVIDPSARALKLCSKRFKEMKSNPHIVSINYFQKIEEVNSKIDLAIVSTTADIRYKVIENLLNRINVKNFILEKILFQSIIEFGLAKKIFNSNKVKAWVNCSRRMIPFYRKLEQENFGIKPIKIVVKGDIGIASNSIHMLDLLAFLSKQTEITIDISKLEKKIYSSKRSNFVEFKGELYAHSSRGDSLKIIDKRNNKTDLTISLENDEKLIIINQTKAIYNLKFKDNHFSSINHPFNTPFQSELTAKQVEQILDTGNSFLPSLEESSVLHKPMIEAFNFHLSSILNKKILVCPIT